MRRRTRAQRGVVLIAVILLIAASIGPAYAFVRRSVLDVMSARQRVDRVRAELLARSGTAVATRALIDDLTSEDPLARAIESPRDPWQLLSAAPIPFEELGGELRIEIEDAGRRISLNALVADEALGQEDRRTFLTRALERVIENMPGRPEEKRYDPEELADAIQDWIDPDTQTRLGDAEEDFYRDRGVQTPLPNRAIFSLAELASVPGLDVALLEAMDAYFSPGSGQPRFDGAGLNPNTAPPHVLALVYIVGTRSFLEDEEVFRVLKARKDGQIFCPSTGDGEQCVDFAATVNQAGQALFPPIGYQSSVFLVRSRARVADASACVVEVLDRSEPDDVKTLAYRLDC